MTLNFVQVPVIAVDGPTASGKGTVAQRVAGLLGFFYLDSGALYRLVALAAIQKGIAPDDVGRLAALAAALNLRFAADRVFLDDQDVSAALRQESVGNMASAVAVFPAVRAALTERQRASRVAPGLVADGRDMGTVIFPDAALKIFLTASVQKRAERRCKQLIEKGFPANIAILSKDLQERDARDAARSVAPLVAAADAVVIDSSDLGIDAVVDQILELARRAGMGAREGV
jgi:cytidylate kinase